MSPIQRGGGGAQDRVKRQVCEALREHKGVGEKGILAVGAALNVLGEKLGEVRERVSSTADGARDRIRAKVDSKELRDEVDWVIEQIRSIEVTADVVEAQLSIAKEATQDFRLLVRQAKQDFEALTRKVCS